ncbi:putative disease resistance protein RGA3 [Hordeum vulgare]|nr:putative disease resistance protein RGA3 [Hordeum vulgare]
MARSSDGGKTARAVTACARAKRRRLARHFCRAASRASIKGQRSALPRAYNRGISATSAAQEEDDDGVLLFQAHLCDTLLELDISHCPELLLMDLPTLVTGEGWLPALQSLQRLRIGLSPMFMSALSFSHHIFPSSLQFVELIGVEGMGTLDPLSNLSSLVTLELGCCGQDLKCQGLRSLLTTGSKLNALRVFGSPRIFAGWDPHPRLTLEDVEGEEEQQPLRVLRTDAVMGLLAAPIFSFISSSLTELVLNGYGSQGMQRFSKDQEEALQLLYSLQELEFWRFHKLQQLPAGPRNLTSLKILSIYDCPAILALPNNGLPKSLQELGVYYDCSKELNQQCRGLWGTIPRIRIG